ncbi:hypothetical protein PsAD37_02494 [Pseudovibrio sp. Ad37]|nr:hypothetical protein PsAD37_02494 [Pseudovibrio sp. Ad37]
MGWAEKSGMMSFRKTARAPVLLKCHLLRSNEQGQSAFMSSHEAGAIVLIRKMCQERLALKLE